jgi:hypothetical protein
MEASRQPRKRPQSEIKPSLQRPHPQEYRRARSTEAIAGTGPVIQEFRKVPLQELTAFSEFEFFDDDEPRAGTVGLSRNSLPDPSAVNLASDHLREVGSLRGSRKHLSRDTSPPDAQPPPLSPPYTETRGLSFEVLTQQSGSPVPRQEFMVSSESLAAIAVEHKLGNDFGTSAQHSAKTNRFVEARPNGLPDIIQDELPTILDNISTLSEASTVSVAKHVAGPGHIEERQPRPKMVDIHKNGTARKSQLRIRSVDQYSKQTHQVHNGAQDVHIRRKSLPVGANAVPTDPTMTLHSMRVWLDNLANKESETWSTESVVDPVKPQEVTSLVAESSTQNPHSMRARPSASPYKPLLSQSSKMKQLGDVKGKAKDTPTAQRSQNVRPATPSPTTRPGSPPLHRNAADNRKPIEKADRETWTLYNISCWTDKAYLKTLTKHPVFEFRVEPLGEPFLVDVPIGMLRHFCGEKHVDSLIRDYNLRPEQRREEDGEALILVFPERIVDSTAIMRVIRFMRRCCLRTTTITKPHFQLHAPPSLEANIETIRACNIFGLYADARRLQYFLTDKKIPGGKLTMEDVETIWEGYGGGLRDSIYTDALLTHLVYNVLGSDSVDREDFMVLLEQKEFAGLRELIGMELGIKKRAAEDRDMFKMRKELEREDKVNHANGKGRQRSKMEKIRAIRGPMVQGRLLRVLSYDALLEPDLTAETRYKPRPGLERRSVSSPDLMDNVDGEEEFESAGSLYQGALKEIRNSSTAAKKLEMMLEGLSDVEEETSFSVRQAQDRPAAPTPSGRKHEVDRPRERQIQNQEGVRPSLPPSEYHPNGIGVKATRNSIADGNSDQDTFRSPARAMGPQSTAPPGPSTRPHADSEPRESSRTHLRVTSKASNGFGSNVKRRQPQSSLANVHRAHSTNGGMPALRSRTDPWWGILGYAPPPAKRKNQNKLKQVWDEVKNLV